MPLPFFVECEQSAPRLYELADGRLQLVEKGALAPFMPGHRYLLVERELAEFLKEVGLERVQYQQAVIYDPLSKEEITTHVRLRVGQLFNSEQIKDINLNGPRLLTMDDEYYFVSPELKVLLEKSSFSYLRFSEGLSGFAGSAA
ncbi:MAG: hypothetical protein Q7T36_17495 [Fluviicoccus sp.]|uniref:hypothetical protein n=1 Tax=Fluviicoccus sp. TaxID=2003552 RepID=UPI002721ED7E|nr:hypothetical protein [Fluviicoccus sp.]MDO8332263.1 hypothetical protein [Fluviicoccus sp.]